MEVTPIQTPTSNLGTSLPHTLVLAETFSLLTTVHMFESHLTLHFSANCLFISFVHFSIGLVFSMICSGYFKVRKWALCLIAFPLQLIPIWCLSVPLNRNCSFKSPVTSRWGQIQMKLFLSSSYPHTQQLSIQLTSRPSLLEHSPHLASLVS